MWKEKTKMYSSSLFQFYETRQRKLWKWWHIYKQHVILICRGALVAFKSTATSAQHSMALSYGKIHVQEQHCPRSRLVTGVDISCYPGDIHPWTRCITLGEQCISFSPGFPSIIPTDKKKFHVKPYSGHSSLFQVKKPVQSHIVPFLGTSRVTFPIFWRIAGLPLSRGHDSLQTVRNF